MRTSVAAILTLSIFCSTALGVPISPFQDTDQYLAKAKDIVVAQCTVAVQEGDSFQMCEGKILKVLKGDRKVGAFKFAVFMDGKPNTTYLLCNRGGSVGDVDFVASPEMAVVPLPSMFKLEDLEGKNLKEQVQYLLSLRLFEVERQLAPLLEEKAMLDKAIADRTYPIFASKGPVKLGDVVQVGTGGDRGDTLVLQGEELKWSESSRGKTGFLYYEKIGLPPWVPHWEFSRCEASKVEDLAGKPLKTRFCGLFSPDRPEGAGYRQSIYVKVGEVLLARTVTKPRRVFVIQLVEQKQEKGQLVVRYAVIQE